MPRPASATREERVDREKAALEQAMQSAEMKDLQESLSVDMTPEGLRIQIIDQESTDSFLS